MTGSHPVEPVGGPEPLDERIAARIAPDTERHISVGEASVPGEEIVREDDDVSRGEDGETFRSGEATQGSKGLGAVWGDPEWAPVDEPMSDRARENEAAAAESATSYDLHETEDGERYLTDTTNTGDADTDN